MRIPCNLVLFIDDCYVSATLIPKSGSKHAGVFVSERKTERKMDEKQSATISILNELSRDIKDRLTKPELVGHHIDECNIILSPSWYIAKSTVVFKHSDKPFVFTKDLLAEEMKSQIEVKGDKDHSDITSDLIKIEQEISHILLNGYSTGKDMYGKKVSSVKAAVYSCFIDKKFKEAVIDSLEIIHHGSIKTEFHSLGKFCINYTIKNSGKSEKINNLVVINFCSYMTEIVYVQGQVEMHLLSIPMGYKDVISKLNTSIHSDHSSADSLLNLLVTDKLKDDSRKLLMTSLDPIKKEWESMIVKGISQLPKNPNTMIDLYVYGADDVQTELAKLFSISLPFTVNQNLSVTLFKNMLANFSVI